MSHINNMHHFHASSKLSWKSVNARFNLWTWLLSHESVSDTNENQKKRN